jgi:hypothetical protein
MAPSPVPGGDSSVAIPTPRFLQWQKEAFLWSGGSDLLKGGHRLKPYCR